MVTMRQRVRNAILALVLAAAALVVAEQSGVAGWLSLDIWRGICCELLQGSTEGRQALVGSCWYGPLPILAGTLGGWLLHRPDWLPVALLVVVWLGWALALYRLGRLVHLPAAARLTGQVAVAAGIATCAGAWQPDVALAAALGVQVAASCADWSVTRRMGALATFSLSLGALVLCGISLGGWSLWALAVLLLVTWRAPGVRRRVPAVLLLGALPLGYAAGVWVLLNWLLLGDPFFFVHPLRGMAFRAVGATAPLEWFALIFGVGSLALATLRRRPDALALGGLACGGLLWHLLLSGIHAVWSEGAALPLALGLGVTGVLCALRDQEPYLAPLEEEPTLCVSPPPPVLPVSPIGIAGVGGLLLLAMLAGGYAQVRQIPRAQRIAARQQCAARQDAIVRAVTAYVQERTPYGRVFVCGYEGLALLAHRAPGSRLIPCLDLHVAECRRLYHGQQLFVLVKRPEGRAAVDGAGGRLPEIYREGAGGLTLFARDFDDWRLFEVVGAPTAKQLREWRQLATPLGVER
jgi:hypothetical protein